MVKLTKPFFGVPDGEIYPKQFAKGDDVTGALADAAIEASCAPKPRGRKSNEPKDQQPPPGNTPPPSKEPSVVGSNILPDPVEIADGETVSLDDVVKQAFAASGLSAEDWNALDDHDREGRIAETVKSMSEAKA